MTDGTTTWTYTYDANGMRTSRSNGTTTYEYVYNGDSLVQMTVGSNKLYFANGGVKFNNAQYYYVTNLQGDVVAIQNSTGAVVVQYTYDAWGNVLSTTGSMASTLGTLNPIRYRSYVYDLESGLYYLQSRYYDPEVGRFLNADAYTSTGQGLLGNNMFTYCLNNPVVLVDPSGNYCVMYHTGQSAFDAMNGIVDAGGGGGQVGPPGWNPGVNIPHFETDTTGKDFSTLYYSDEFAGGTKTIAFLSGSVDMFSFGSDGCTFFGFSTTLYSLDYEIGNMLLSLAEIGNVSLSASGTPHSIKAEALISVWSPSVSFEIGSITLTFGAHIGAYGCQIGWQHGKGRVGGALGTGGYFEWEIE